MKGFPSKNIALKIDVLGQENMLFGGMSVHHSAWKFYRRGAVKGLNVNLMAENSLTLNVNLMFKM